MCSFACINLNIVDESENTRVGKSNKAESAAAKVHKKKHQLLKCQDNFFLNTSPRFKVLEM